MNKVNILSIVFAGICAFSACTDDKDPVINDLKANLPSCRIREVSMKLMCMWWTC